MHLKRFRGETVRDALAAGPSGARAGGARAVDRSWCRRAAGAAGRRARGRSDRRRRARRCRNARSARQEVRQPERRTTVTRPGRAPRGAPGFAPAVARGGAAGAADERPARREPPTPCAWPCRHWVAPYVRGGRRATRAVEVFVGPPGAGKTTTIAKIAAQERARRGAPAAPGRGGRLPRRRGRAAAALRRHHRRAVRGRAHAPRDLDAALSDCDAVRCSSTPPAVRRATVAPREYSRVLSERAGVRTHLVLPAGNSASRGVARIIALYSDVAARDRLVLTRLDEGGLAGAISSTCCASAGCRSRISAHGQRVPDDLLRATPRRLAAACSAMRCIGAARHEAPGRTASTGYVSIAVTSGKGGVGKTNVAINLAVAPGALGHRVAIARRRLRSRQRRRAARPRRRGAHRPRARRRKLLADVLVGGPRGVQRLPAGSGVPPLTALTPKQWDRARRRARRDRGRSRLPHHRHRRRHLRQRDRRDPDRVASARVVTSLDPAAVVDAYAVIKLLSTTDPAQEIGIVVNNARDASEAQLVFAQLEVAAVAVPERRLTYFGFIADDPGGAGAGARASGRSSIICRRRRRAAASAFLRRVCPAWRRTTRRASGSLAPRQRRRPASPETPQCA